MKGKYSNSKNNYKTLILIAMIAALIFTGIGFAAFSSSLTISSSSKVSTDASLFTIAFSKAASSASTGCMVQGTDTANVSVSGSTLSGTATLSGTSVTNMSATFKKPGDSITFTFYTRNTSEYVAYLNSVTLGSKTCTAKSGTTQSLVDSACNGISISIKAGSTTYTSTNSNISSHSIAAGGNETIVVTLTYASGSTVPDGDFDVTWGTSTLTYSTAD